MLSNRPTLTTSKVTTRHHGPNSSVKVAPIKIRKVATSSYLEVLNKVYLQLNDLNYFLSQQWESELIQTASHG